MVYSNEEIELTLNFYSIAKLHIDNLNQALQFKELNDYLNTHNLQVTI